jgi:hypothetical protein
MFAGALLLCVIAKFAELNDHEIAAVLGVPTGHTLKHLLATASAALVVACLMHRVRAPLIASDPDAMLSGKPQRQLRDLPC